MRARKSVVNLVPLLDIIMIFLLVFMAGYDAQTREAESSLKLVREDFESYREKAGQTEEVLAREKAGLSARVEELDRDLAGLERRRRELETANQELSARVRDFSDLKAGLEAEVGDLRLSLNASGAIESRLLDQVVDLKRVGRETQERLDQSQQELARTSKRVEDLSAKRDRLEQELGRARAGLDQAANRTASLEGEQAEMIRELTAARRDLARLSKEKETLQANLESAKKEQERIREELIGRGDDLARELARAKVGLDKAANRTSSLKTEKAGMMRELTAARRDLERLSREKQTLQASLDAAEKEKGLIRDELRVAERSLAEFEKNRNQTRAELADMKRARAEASAKREGLSAELDRLSAELDRLAREKSESEERLQTTYDSLISNLKSEIRQKEVTIDKYKDQVKIKFVDRILFDTGSTVINSQGREVLSKILASLAQVRDKRIYIVGHTDNVPIGKELTDRFPTNWELSSARAAAVVRFLVERGRLDPKLLAPVGRSYLEPLADNKAPAGRAENRRVEIVIAGSLELN